MQLEKCPHIPGNYRIKLVDWLLRRPDESRDTEAYLQSFKIILCYFIEKGHSSNTGFAIKMLQSIIML